MATKKKSTASSLSKLDALVKDLNNKIFDAQQSIPEAKKAYEAQTKGVAETVAGLTDPNYSAVQVSPVTGGPRVTAPTDMLAGAGLPLANELPKSTAKDTTTSTQKAAIAQAEEEAKAIAEAKAAQERAAIAEATAATNRLAAAQEAANAKPMPAGTKTVRKVGGIVETVQLMYNPVTGATTEGAVIDSYKDLSARESVLEQFKNTGLEQAFVDKLIGVIDTVYNTNAQPTTAQIENAVINSEPFKTRFAANEAIRKRIADGKGLPGDRLLSPAEYIEAEKGYKQILQEAGLPEGFYDTPDDFTKLIENSISVAEFTERVNIAKDAVNKADKNIVDALKNYYGLSTADLQAYMLDSQRAFEGINSKFKYTTEEAKKMYGAAEIGGAALRAGMTATQATAEEIYKGGKASQAEAAFQGAAQDRKAYERLRALSGQQAGAEDLVRMSLGLAGGSELEQQTKKLASKERARFQQQSAIGTTSLSRKRQESSL